MIHQYFRISHDRNCGIYRLLTYCNLFKQNYGFYHLITWKRLSFKFLMRRGVTVACVAFIIKYAYVFYALFCSSKNRWIHMNNFPMSLRIVSVCVGEATWWVLVQIRLLITMWQIILAFILTKNYNSVPQLWLKLITIFTYLCIIWSYDMVCMPELYFCNHFVWGFLTGKWKNLRQPMIIWH